MEHNDIVMTDTKALWNNGVVKTIVTEYRADGCVTWRELGG